MREGRGRHNAHFLLDNVLLPHAIVKIPSEKMHVGVCFIYFLSSFQCVFVSLFLFCFSQISTGSNVTVRVCCVALLSSPPPMPSSVRCIAYDFDGSNVDDEDYSKLRYEDGGIIPNVEEYFLEDNDDENDN
jgi:hypothetical protein